MLYNSWEENLKHYHDNYNSSYHYIMNKTVPSISIVSSIIGLVICVFLWKLIHQEMHNRESKIDAKVTNVLIAFTFTNTIGQLVTFASSVVFLRFFEDLYPKDSVFNNPEAEILGAMYIWIRLANTCLIFIMLLKSITTRVFILWNQMVICSVLAPVALAIYALLEKITGFLFSQLPLGSCSIVMCPNLPSFKECLIWTLVIEMIDVALFVFNCILIIQIRLEKREEFEMSVVPLLRDKPLIPNLNHLLIYVSSVMMVAKSVEVIRIFSVVSMFAEMEWHHALHVGMFNYALMIMQALFECGQPVLAYIFLIVFIQDESRLLFFLPRLYRSFSRVN